MIGRMKTFLLTYRRPFVVLLHLALIAAASYVAFLLRFDGAIPAQYLDLWWRTLPWLVAIRGATFAPFRLYEGMWRYTSIWDLRNIILGTLLSSLLFVLVVQSRFGGLGYPRSVFIIDAVLLVVALGGVRLGRRLRRELITGTKATRVLIFGAGDAGEMVVRDMRSNDSYNKHPIGFIDDDSQKVGARIHGVPVLGTRQDLARVILEYKPHELLVSLPSASPAVIRELVRALESYKLPITTLPSLPDLMGGRIQVEQIRGLRIEDLLPRAPVGLNAAPLRQLIAGRRVLVTGAGGSIGSELCRQIAALDPERLVLYERYENGLFAIGNDLIARHGASMVSSMIGDVTDADRLDAVMRDTRPAVVFHAAAHKHVPLMELNPCEAVKNNVLGTRLAMEVSARHGVERFVLISTDKAVKPSSVMGATKRVAELLVQGAAERNGTRFMAVRFGNVLGSNGSVIPTFMEQIRARKPVTVTHPDMQRYFMLIPEAVELVLHAASLAQPGAVYVLDMGDQIKLVDMARNLIRLTGFIPEEEIPIVFTGLRPGEKLIEQLVGDDESAEPSGMEKVQRIRPHTATNFAEVAFTVAEIERHALAGDSAETLRELARVTQLCAPEVPVASGWS